MALQVQSFRLLLAALPASEGIGPCQGDHDDSSFIKPVVGVVRPPIYLHVPPGHARDWSKHCHKYNSCGERVFFVHERWYNGTFVPHHQKRHGKLVKNSHEGNNGKGKGKN